MTCKHHWLISDVAVERNGRRIFPAVCRLCHHEKEYPTNIDDTFNPWRSTAGGPVSVERERGEIKLADGALEGGWE